METLEILFVALPIVALIAAVALFFSIIKKDKEYTITLNIESDEIEPPVAPEPVAKPKRRYKRRKKKAPVVVEAPKAEIVPAAVKKRVGRPKKTT
jgi:hypothetical protein